MWQISLYISCTSTLLSLEGLSAEVLKLQIPLVCLCLQAGWLESKLYTQSPTPQKEVGFRVQLASCPAEFTEEVIRLFSSVRVFQSVAQQLPQVYQWVPCG